ncbi:MAG TPA: chromosome segregation protein SMC, partial [Opitutaceae bacterium]|nr:chromosome segregation protein SMC [Opitutaceae bacterium]
MYLQALKLHGFKSFADPTVLRFEPGVTAIVGPNGCGKSNIADAIRWVLGEQSAKALRGGKMQDVIFEGAETRRPQNLCEVALLLTDCEAQLGVDYHEVEIMRRTTRDGLSDYYLNGQVCRLKDIHRLFMDTGVGRTSYSIMAQGQIDQVLSSKPEERRAVFEEAAGITRYKSQRREALAKLALTDQNLARITDVIAEVGRQIGSLRRQAAKAMRYKRLSYRLRHLSLAHGGWQWGQLQTTIAGLEADVAGLRAAAGADRTALEERQRELAGLKARRSDDNQRVQEAQQAVFDLRSQREQAENQAGLAGIKRTGLEERIQSSRDDLTELEMQLREVSAQADTGAQDKQTQLNLLGSSDAVFQQRNRELAIVEGEMTRAEQELEQAKFDLLQLESTMTRLRTDCSGFEVESKTSVVRHDELAAQLAEARAAQAAAATRAGEERRRLDEAHAGQSRAHNEVQAAQHALQEATLHFRDGQRQLQDLDRALAQRTARLRLLEQLRQRWEGFGEGAKAVLQGQLESVLAGHKAAPVTYGIEVRPDYGPALEALLGSAVEAIAVAELPLARRVLAHLEEHRLGSACLQVPAGTPGGPPAADLPAFLQPATVALVNLQPGHPLVGVLAGSFIAASLDEFLEYWRANPGFNFLRVATPKGEMVDRRGLIYGGYQKKPVAGIVQREIDLRETARELAREQQLHAEQRGEVERLAAALAAAETALEQRRKDVLAATQQVAAVQAEARNADKASDELAGRLPRLERELAGLDRARSEAETRLTRARASLTEAEQKVTDRKEAIGALEVRLAELRAARDQKKEALAQARLELAERRQRVEVLDRGLDEMERRRAQLAELLTQRQQEVEVWTEQAADLGREAEAQLARAAEIARTLGVAQESVEKIRGELAALEQQIAAVETVQQELRTRTDAMQEDLGRSEVKLAESRSRAQFMAEEVQHEFQTDLATVDWKQLLWHAEDDPPDLKPLDLDDDEPEAGEQRSEVSGQKSENGDSEAKPKTQNSKRKTKRQRPPPTEADLAALDQTNWEEVKAAIEALRQRLGSMGPVNLVAIEEYAELRQRYDFLKAQSDDLTAAKTQLVQAIDQINRTSQQQFEITFQQVQKSFEFTFQTLFGGGHARLELVQTEDILESGIEIIAQPPGTRLKSISLLSGGQKTLTAVALLFALYMVKPSPFCLLDELDAPLDESNIGRFTKLLRNFVQHSQFLIITHNKRTIAAANGIYGVTMEERGVSKTVSMRFNHERGEAEAVPATVADAVRSSRVPVVEPL